MAGFQNNPLTKFPLSIHPPGSSTRVTPGAQAPVAVHTPIGPVAYHHPQQITPLGAKVKTFGDRAIGLPPSVSLPLKK